MQRFNRFALIASLCATAGCGSKGLPVDVTRCDVLIQPHETTLEATVTNRADKPIGSIGVQLDFYNNYRFTRTNATLRFAPVLDPGTSRKAAAKLQAPGSLGSAMHCIATHITYGDGTTQG
jgi:predicted small lipoprotein YifL